MFRLEFGEGKIIRAELAVSFPGEKKSRVLVNLARFPSLDLRIHVDNTHRGN